MTIKNRLAKLEKRADEQPARRVDVIEIHKAYEDGHTEIEVMDLRTAKPSEILARAEELIAAGAQPTADQSAAMESIRMATHEHKNTTTTA